MQGATWLEHHLETFVKPYLGHVPNPYESVDPVAGEPAAKVAQRKVAAAYIKYFNDQHIICLVDLWSAAKDKAGERPILLPGRDAWLFEVVARLEGFPTTFDPRLSSSVCHFLPDADKAQWANHYAVDTCCSGSVPKALKVAGFGLVACGCPNPGDRERLLLIPKPTMMVNGNPVQSNVSSYMEGCHKYWVRGNVTMDTHQIIPQALSPKGEFTGAAKLTIHVARRVLALFYKSEFDMRRKYAFYKIGKDL